MMERDGKEMDFTMNPMVVVSNMMKQRESSTKSRLKQPANEHNQDYGPQHIIDTSNEKPFTVWFRVYN